MKRLLITLLLVITTSVTFAQPFKHGMVVSESKLASMAGVEILEAGGNAVDAAVAVGYMLAVVNPCCGNIGGGGFMTIHLKDGKNIFLNFREMAPLAANPDMYKNKKIHSTLGYLAVGVPGTVLGLDTALEKYGTMSRKTVMAKAIQTAQNGYKVTPYGAEQFEEVKDLFRADPVVSKIFLKNGETYKANETLVQKDLAHTLTLIAENGPKVFYDGPIAKSIVKASKEHGGILTFKDFADYHITIHKPIKCTYRGYTLLSAPPPSSGGTTLCEMLNILENFPLKNWGRKSLKSTQTTIEAMRYGYIDRNTKLGDPAFIDNPVEELTSKAYAKRISDIIKKTHYAPHNFAPKNHPEMTDTTHYSVVDQEGNAVAVTYTLNGFFGSGVMAPNTGFFLNNEMDDFSIAPGSPNKFGLVHAEHSQANKIEAKKRPLSSMSPTILLKDNQIFMVIGSPGGPRIITSVLLTLLDVIDYNVPLQEAVNLPRFHYQANPDVVDTEYFSPAYILRSLLEQLHYHVMPQKPWGAIEAIQVDPKTHQLSGGSDSRRPDGAAVQTKAL